MNRFFSLFFLFFPFFLFAQEKAPDFLPIFPMEQGVFDAQGKELGRLKLYPSYVEFFDSQGKMQGKAGRVIDVGYAIVLLQKVKDENSPPLVVGKSYQFQVYGQLDFSLVGGFFYARGMEVFIYGPKKNYLGRTLCPISLEFCGALATAYFIGLLS